MRKLLGRCLDRLCRRLLLAIYDRIQLLARLCHCAGRAGRASGRDASLALAVYARARRILCAMRALCPKPFPIR